MRWWMKLCLRVRSLFGSSAVDRELDAELQFHMQEHVDELVAAGVPRDEARLRARQALGGLDQVAEACRDQRRVRPLQDLVRDARYGARLLARAPLFTTVAVLTLALGIGANAAMFSVVHAVLVAPLPYPDADRIVSLGSVSKATGHVHPRLTGADLADIVDAPGSLETIGGYRGGELGVQVHGRGEFAGTYLVSAGFLRTFGIVPAYGRLLDERDVDRGAVVGWSFAARVFGRPSDAVGHTLNVEGQAYEIVGVTKQGFAFPERAEVWLSDALPTPSSSRTAFNFMAIAKLAPGVTIARAQARLGLLAEHLAKAYPGSNQERGFAVTPLKETLVEGSRTTLYLLVAAVGLVLLIACANVSNLLLARATTRWREVAIRTALGASRWRVVRQLAIENVLLALLGGSAGVAVAYGATPLLVRLAPETFPRLAGVAVDRSVLGFAAALTVMASVVFSLAPAWQATRTELHSALKLGAARGPVGRRLGRLGDALVVAEISLALVLAIGAGLLGRSLGALSAVDLGFHAEQVLVVYAHMPAQGLEQYVEVARFGERLFPELRAVPGVRDAAAAMGLPAGRYGSNGAYDVEGRVLPPGRSRQADFTLASPGYFTTIGVPLLAGREFAVADRYDTEFVALVSESLARSAFPGEDPIGKRLRCGLDSSKKWMTIVGVVGDVRRQPALAPVPTLYMPLTQHPYHANEVQIVVRADGTPSAIGETARAVVRRLFPDAATSVTTMPQMLERSTASPRFRTVLVGGFALLALLLAMAGVYGVMSHVAAERTTEFGLRMALGGQPRQLFLLVVRQALGLSAAGLVLGLGGAASAGRFVRSFLFELEPIDPATYVTAALLVAAVVVAAASFPAIRASRTDPMRTLRSE